MITWFGVADSDEATGLVAQINGPLNAAVH